MKIRSWRGSQFQENHISAFSPDNNYSLVQSRCVSMHASYFVIHNLKATCFQKLIFNEIISFWRSHHGLVEMNLTSIHEETGSIPGLTQWGWGSRVAVTCGVGHRRGLDLVLLWLWCRLVATAVIQPLALEPPYAVGTTLKKTKTKNSDDNSNNALRLSWELNDLIYTKSQNCAWHRYTKHQRC